MLKLDEELLEASMAKKRGPKPSGAAKTTVGVRLGPDLLRRLEAHLDREAAKLPSSVREKYNLSDVIRGCIERCLDEEEARLKRAP